MIKHHPKVKLVDGGPEFVVERGLNVAPTFEQAIVYCFREAQKIMDEGYELHRMMLSARNCLRLHQLRLDNKRKRKGVVRNIDRGKNISIKDLESDVCGSLDCVHGAQEKYNPWIKLYGELY